jgi:DNA mismatch repair protein MutS
LKHLRNYNVQVRELNHEIVFLHRIAPGSAERSYGIHVARLAGIPERVWIRANDIMAQLEARHQLPQTQRLLIEPPEKPKKKKPPTEPGPTLFEEK